MKRIVIGMIVWAAAASSLRAADAGQPLTLVEAQPFGASAVSTTGRAQALVCARIGARVSGTIVEFGKDAAGRMLDAGAAVKAGDVLFRLDETTFRNALAMAEAALQSAQANLDNLTAKTRQEKLEQLRQAVAELDVRIADQEREEQRFRRLVEEEKTLPARRLEEAQTQLASLKALRKIAQARLEEAENGPTATEVAIARARVREAEVAVKAAQDDLRDATVRAPYDGLVIQRLKSPGDYATGAPHTEIIELLAPDRLEIELKLPEAYLPHVQAGKTIVAVRSPGVEKELRLPVGRVVPAVDAASGTFVVRVPVPSQYVAAAAAKGGIAPGAFVSAEIRMDEQSLGVLVPLRAVVEKDGKAVIFVAEGGRMVRRPVDLGDRLTELAVIKGGLARGEKVVVGPPDALKDGAPLPDYLTATRPAK